MLSAKKRIVINQGPTTAIFKYMAGDYAEQVRIINRPTVPVFLRKGRRLQ